MTECFYTGTCYDTDSDAKLDYVDTDSDNDRWSDKEECKEAQLCEDNDRDGIPNYLDPDTNKENKGGDADGDADGDGKTDREECPSGVPCPDENGNKVPDYFELDSDGDLILDRTECFESGLCYDTEGDGSLDRLDTDSDADGKPDTDECGALDPCPDTDKDGIEDYLDPDTNWSKPNGDVNGDADKDGIKDTIECVMGTPCPDTDGDLIPDYFDTDSDNDGDLDKDECPQVIDNKCPDSDGDGVPDWLDDEDDPVATPTSMNDGVFETPIVTTPTTPEPPLPPVDNVPQEPTLPEPEVTSTVGKRDFDPNGDDDKDGLPNGLECFIQELCSDSDMDGDLDYQDTDSDNDGTPDNKECPDYQNCRDTDRDGLPDYIDPDTNDKDPKGDKFGDADGDGTIDSLECPAWPPCLDTNENTFPNFIEPRLKNDDVIDLIPILAEISKWSNVIHRRVEAGFQTMYMMSYNTNRAPIGKLFNEEDNSNDRNLRNASILDETIAQTVKGGLNPLCKGLRRNQSYAHNMLLAMNRYRAVVRSLAFELPHYHYRDEAKAKTNIYSSCEYLNEREILKKTNMTLRKIKASRDAFLNLQKRCGMTREDLDLSNKLDNRLFSITRAIMGAYLKAEAHLKQKTRSRIRATKYPTKLLICEPK